MKQLVIPVTKTAKKLAVPPDPFLLLRAWLLLLETLSSFPRKFPVCLVGFYLLVCLF